MALWLAVVHHRRQVHEELPDPLTNYGPTGINVVPDDLEDFLCHSNLERFFTIVRFNRQNKQLFWDFLQPDVIFLVFNEERHWIWNQPRCHGYTIRAVGKWSGRRICVAHAPIIHHSTSFDLVRFEVTMQRAPEYTFD